MLSNWFKPSSGPRLALCFLMATLALRAAETLPSLKVGEELYTDVTINEVTATDIYFKHSRGIGNAKLKNLDPELQKRFNFNAAKAGEVEQKRIEGNLQFRQDFAAQKAAEAAEAAKNAGHPTDTVPPPTTDSEGDIVVPKLYAKSLRGQRPPQIFVEQWLTPPPDVNGKFVLVDFWATWCGPCRQSIPHLNSLFNKFKDRLVVIGLSDESAEDVLKMKSVTIDYHVGVDPQARTMHAVEVTGIPHAILIDPKGIVRFEGMPTYLDEKGLERLLTKYGN